ncbi:MAG: DNA repair protein RecO [Roseiflexus sp.]|nr:DNA repair protein RecO [Roseiflexus sp.]MCS7290921.1 DNA repair protein RecO [Roseiflexus sp.]MDW8147125.1 DNA repair protein RecO [Roseiflexaceae bacterium]MDW8231687.1 DNA repair protein RecO [Roseiflexaceae bacterium]
MRERVYRSEAIIIRRYDIGEADRVLTILTPSGKRRVVARGARKIQSRLAGHIELFTHTTLMLAIGRNLHIVTQSSPLDRFVHLRADLERIGAAYYVAELADRLIEEESENQRAFELLLGALRALDSGASVDLTLRAYELHLLDALGYRPQLHECASCGATLTEATDRLSPAAGGALCSQCADAEPQALSMSLPVFKLLRYLQVQPLEMAGKLRVSSATRAAAESLLRAYLRHILECDLRSLAFLDDVRLMRHADAAAPIKTTEVRHFAQGDDDENDRSPPGAW